MLPEFIIIGAQKSASTFVQSCLKAHKDIFIPEEEVPFFESPDYEEYEGNLLELENLCPGGEKRKIFGIKRPNYLGKSEVPKRIYKNLPNAKLIVVLRDPIERAASAYYHNIKYGFIPAIHIEEGIPKILGDKEFLIKNPRASEILTFGLYAKCLNEYFKFFRQEDILILFHEDIIKEPAKEIGKVCSFLGVESYFNPNALSSRPQAVTYNLKRLKFIRIRNKYIFKYNEENERLDNKNVSATARAINILVSGVDKIFLSRVLGNEKPKISTDLKKMLADYYKEDVRQLERMLGADLREWLSR